MRVDRLFDLFAPIYNRVVTPLDGLALSRAVERLKAGQPKTVLEVAAGAGRGLRDLVEQTGSKVTAVDSSMSALSVARRAVQGPAVRFAQAEAASLPFRDHSFDAVVATYVLELLTPDEGRQVLSELVRVTAPGGRLVVGVLLFSEGVIQKAVALAEKAAPLIGQRPLLKTDGLFPPAGARMILDETVPGTVGMRLATMMKVGA